MSGVVNKIKMTPLSWGATWPKCKKSEKVRVGGGGGGGGEATEGLRADSYVKQHAGSESGLRLRT